MKNTLIYAIALTVTGGVAHAQSATDQIVSDLQGQGFQRIEIDNGLGQIKIEAIRDKQKVEVVYDSATGRILKQDVERIRTNEETAPGVFVRERPRTFVEVALAGRDDDYDDDDDRDRGRGGTDRADRDDDDDGKGRGRGRGGDDDRDDGRDDDRGGGDKSDDDDDDNDDDD